MSAQNFLAIVQRIANIPFGEARTVEEVLEKNMGTCTGKHLLLQARLDHLNISYRPVVCTFRWQDQGIIFPSHLQKILDACSWDHGHNFIQVKSDAGAWIDLDITWDLPLAPYGFHCLPADWDGTSSFIGLKTLIERWDGVSIAEKKKELIDALTPEQRHAREEFLREFIQWVDSLRR